MTRATKTQSPLRKWLGGGIAFGAALLSPNGDPATNTPEQPREQPSTGFRVPFSVSSVQATMHVSTIANLTTVLRFKSTIMNRSHGEINALITKLHTEAHTARNAGDSQALLRSTKRLMLMTEVLRDRVVMSESKKK